MNIPAAYGLLAHGLLFGAMTALLPLGELRARVALAATTLALVVGIAPAMHGFFGMPSVTLLQLAMLQLAGREPSPLSHRAAWGLIVGAAILYPTALGWGPFDLYALCYQPAPLLLALLPVGLALAWKKQLAWLTILAVDLLAYASGVFANLWDVLFDPLLVVLALIVAGRQIIIRILAKKIRQPG